MRATLSRRRTPVPALFALLTLLCVIPRAEATTVKSEWVLRDARLRARVARSIEEYYRFALDDSAGTQYIAERRQSAEIVIEAIDNREENTRRLVAVSVDSVRVAGTDNIRAALGETLYDFVTARKGYEYDVNRTTSDEQRCSVLWWPDERIRVGLDQQFVRISPSFAVIDQIGEPNLLMPWWHYGMVRIGVAHPNFRFMFQGPFAPGRDRLWFIDPRRIDGAFGGAFEFRVENWSGEIAYATMSKQTGVYDAFTHSPFVNYVSTVVQVRYSVTASAGSLGSLQFTFGGGLHKVQHDSLGEAPQNLLYDAAQESPLTVSPLFTVAFVSAHDDVELTGQYYHSSLMFSAAARIAGPVWLRGSAVMIKALHTPDPWEPDNVLFLTPEIRL